MKHTGLLFIGGGAVVVILGVMGYVWLSPTTPVFQYSTAAPAALKQTVTATGQINGAQSVDLSFDRSGRVAKVYVPVGGVVKAGDQIVALENSLEASELAEAQAALNQRLAGATDSQVAMVNAAADAAKADFEKTQADAAGAVVAAQAALDTAWNNLQLASGGDSSQVVTEAYENAVASIQSALPTLDNALTQANNVIGVDNSSVSTFPQQYDAALDINKLTVAKALYNTAKADRLAAQTATANLTLTSSHADVSAGLSATLTAVADANDLLGSVTAVLEATPAQGNLSATQLDQEKTIVSTSRSAVAAQYATLIGQKQALTNAASSLTTYTIAYNQAQQNLADVKSSTAATVNLKQAAYQQALANVTDKTAPPRAVDVAALRAAVSAAEANFDQTIIRSPIDGVVTRQDAKMGSMVSGLQMPGATPLVSVINEDAYQIKPLIPENTVGQIKVGDAVDVTIDAYGLGTVFPATVVAIDPAVSTAADGTSGYQTTIQFSQADDRIKAGMTGNVSIVVASTTAAVAVPESSVITRNGQEYVQVANGKTTRQQAVTVGIKGDNGLWEITSGLSAGDKVVNFGN